ncbi:metal-independent phosphoserine phosphatase-like [Magnolia sinica]|uniref:metal-independent phosphoserine phosphatase-like n=1 Tax=Magnolia sinica TaxID=86752 RepID=UPI0026584264|nr:metal-independent phosphoserine phosphatase-like [Magnolia sinica]
MATCLVSSNERTINAMVAIATESECAAEIPHDVAEIVIVRHGETTWNASGRIQGQLESELNEVGWKQAAAITERLGKESKPTAVYSSELKLAKNMAEMIAKNCHIHEGGGESFNQLCERSVGALEEIASRHKGERVIVVTHGGVLRAIYMSLTCEPTAGKVLNASINVLHLSEKKLAFETWSDVAHLNEVGFLQRGFNGDALPQP